MADVTEGVHKAFLLGNIGPIVEQLMCMTYCFLLVPSSLLTTGLLTRLKRWIVLLTSGHRGVEANNWNQIT